MDNASTGQIMAELRALTERAEALLKGQGLGDAKESVEEALRELEALVRKNPWAAVAIAAGAGLVLGVLMSRK